MGMPGSVRPARGFSYLGLLFVLAVMGLAASATVRFGVMVERRQAEDELLFVGREFRNALRSYQSATPPNAAQRQPTRLQDLLRDPRFPEPRRHLRRIYADPLTGRAEWGLIKSLDGALIGVYSLSTDTPLRMAHFPADFFYFQGKTHYRDWLFVYGVECLDSGCRLPPSTTSVYR
jgi:type II secretory pathway pseudopilin PulG